MAALPQPFATCLTCGTAFCDYEIPGQRCAHPGCEIWICEGGCLDHFSFVCECGGRFCGDHKVEQYGTRFCPGCAAREWNTCQACKSPDAQVARRLPDGTGICGECYRTHDRNTRGFPPCPHCHHRIWMADMDEQVWRRRDGKLVVRGPKQFFHCIGCGQKFDRETANAERERWEKSQQPAQRAYLAPASAAGDERRV